MAVGVDADDPRLTTIGVTLATASREAHHLQSAWWKNEWVDEYVYAILAPDWLERRSPGLRHRAPLS